MVANTTFSTAFCETPFLDSAALLNSTYPAVTDCFRHTVLVYAPCGFLWLAGAVHLRHVRARVSRLPVPHSLVNLTKIALCLLLACLYVTHGALFSRSRLEKQLHVPVAHTISVVLQPITYFFAALLTWMSRKALIVSPCVLFIFWLLSLTASIVPFYTAVLTETDHTMFVLSVTTFVTLCVQLILNCWGEASLRHVHYLQSDEMPSPEVFASFPSKITFHWMISLIYLGFKRTLTPEDVWDLPPQCKGQALIDRFQHTLRTYTRTPAPSSLPLKCGPRARQTTPSEKTPLLAKPPTAASAHDLFSGSSSRPPAPAPETSFRSSDVGAEKGAERGAGTWGAGRREVPLLRCLATNFYRDLLYSNLLRVFGDCFQFANPALLQYMEHRDLYPAWYGYTLVAGFFVVTSLVSLCLNQNIYQASNTGMKIRTALVAAVYRKALVMSSGASRQHTSGAIVNLMAVDCHKLQTVSAQVWVLLSAPLQISLSLYFLHVLLGPSCLVGVACLLLLIPINIRVSVAARRHQATQLTLKDQRLKLLSEMLVGIKVIKLSAWEDSFVQRVSHVRDQEVAVLRRVAILTTITVFNWICSPILVTTGTLVTFTLLSSNGLDPATAFGALALFTILKQPVNQLPECVSELVQSHVSLRRLGEFLSCEELKPSDICRNAEDGVAISVRSATFTWDRTLPPSLSKINVEVLEGQLLAVVGPVGAGKSSLLSALLGEMTRLKGRVAVRGSVAYVPQQAWIQNRSLRDCVVFENPYDHKRYRKIVRACALKPDIEDLPAGDLTEIGEKGINLSGGQKLRVTLARAVYRDADVILMDDPLSALDSHVAKHVFRRVVGAGGMLKNKTRVMVTHGVHWLPMCDVIVVMERGHVVQTGTYEQLLKHDGPFARYLKTHLRQDSDHLDPEIQKILSQMHVRVENITSDGMTSADEDEYRYKKKSSRPRERAAETRGKDGHHADRGQGRQLVQEERSQTGRIQGVVLRELLRVFGVGAALTALVLLVLYSVIGVSADVILAAWTSDDILTNSSAARGAAYQRRTMLYVGVYGAMGVAQTVLTLLFVVTVHVSMLGATRRLHGAMLASVVRQPLLFFHTNPLGRVLNRFSRDLDAVDGEMARLVRGVAMQVMTVVSVLVVITYATPIFGAAAVAMVIIYYLVQKFYIPCSRQLRRYESVSRSPIYSHFSETLSGAASIRAFDVTQRFQSESRRLVDRNNCFFYAFVSASRWLRVRLELLGNAVVVLAALFAIQSRDLSASLAGLSVSYALQVTAVLTRLVQNSSQLESVIVSVERLVEYTLLPQEPAWVRPDKRPGSDWPSRGVIRYQQYSTRYRPGLDLVLTDITCTIQQGHKVGIVGRTGAGKSSLSLSIFRLLEAASGCITIDGVNIASMGLHDLRSRLTILPQDPVLFSGSLRFNLDPLRQFADAEVWAALEQAKLSGLVDHTPEGLSFTVEEGGANLSVGQRQLVCLARALLRKTRVLVLDEATAAVDLETDDVVQKMLRTAFRDTTVITIAHRINTVMDYDKIIVLEKGRIVEMDSPDSLLEDRTTLFYRMAQQAQLVP